MKMAKTSGLGFTACVLLTICIALFSCTPPVGPGSTPAVFVPVDDITKVPRAATVGIPLPLTAFISPANATNQIISWDVNIGPASIEDNTLIASDAGYVIITARIIDGRDPNEDFYKDFFITANSSFVPVSDITGIPAGAVVDVPLTLDGLVAPENATNQSILWNVESGPAVISGDDLVASDTGTVILSAKITDGSAEGTDYTKKFTVNATRQVAGIGNVPAYGYAGVSSTLNGTIIPDSASTQKIVWKVESGSATISNNNILTIDAKASGSVTLSATVANGLPEGEDFVETFTLPIVHPVTGITGVPAAAISGVPLTLSGTVAPDDAVSGDIVWGIKSGSASIIDGNKLLANTKGTVVITGTVVNGRSWGSDFTGEFSIAVMQLAANITGVPTATTARTPLTLTGTVTPASADYKTITWSVYDPGDTGAYITNGNILNTTAGGIAVVTGTVANNITPDSSLSQNFSITVIEPVTDIQNVPLGAIVGTPFALTAKVVPDNATNQTIVWNIVSGAATITGGLFNASSPGKVTVGATIKDGVKAGTSFSKNFDITAIRKVTGISGVPSAATVGVPLTLTATVSPNDSSIKPVAWSVLTAGNTGATISGNILKTTGPGTATIEATIADGSAFGTPYAQDFTITVSNEAVSVISGIPAATTVGTLTLEGTVTPSTATNQSISWDIKDKGTTGATITSDNNLNTSAGGTVIITGTIDNGGASGTAYTQDFTITVIMPVTNISNVPAAGAVGGNLDLSVATAEPGDASNKTIVWSIQNARTTGATISGTTLKTTAAGTVTVTATITNGSAVGTPYAQNFNITIIQAVTGISGIPSAAQINVPLTLTGTVAPSNATYKTIAWNVQDAGTTGATISGNTLNATAAGTVTVTAVVADGLLPGTDYSKKDIAIKVDVVPVTSITNVPVAAIAATDLTLTGIVNPYNATNQNITWSVKSSSNTTATISAGSNILKTTTFTQTQGTVVVTATIANGKATGTPYTQDFTITVNKQFVPVTGISMSQNSALTGVPFALQGTVAPTTATNQNIIWSIENGNDGGTGATIDNNDLNTTHWGTVTVTATIVDGTASGISFTKGFPITVTIRSVTGISGVPTAAIAGTPLSLTGTVTPSDATNQTIVWTVQNAGTTGATINGTTLNTSAGGTVTITGTIINGTNANINYSENFVITVIKPVTDISGIPAAGAVGDLDLSSVTVEPNDASKKTIVWTVQNAGTTGATISDSTLKTNAAGTVIVSASITDGLAVGTPYTTGNFNITIIQPVTDITGVATTAYPGTALPLAGTVTPANATNKTITWSVQTAGTTGATITGNTLNVTAAGTATIRATIKNAMITTDGKLGDYTKDYSISVVGTSSITLTMNNFTMPDEGSDVFTVYTQEPIVLSKGAGTIQPITIDASNFTGITWKVGNISLGSGNSVTLKAVSFNVGKYTLSISFTRDGKPWLASLPFEVTN